jgi:hypothetical protein
VIHTHSKAKLNTMMRAKAIAPLTTPPWRRKPTTKPARVMMRRAHTCVATSATARPESTAVRGIGNERRRSYRPCPRSSAILTAALIPDHSSIVVMMPGTAKSTYGRLPVPIAPPKM